jgi:hypothetical protein
MAEYGIYTRLNINNTLIANDVSTLSNTTSNFVNIMPKMLNDWQATDVATGNTSGYHVNPVITPAQSIKDTSDAIITLTTSVSGLESILANSQNLSSNTALFITHTNRMSGVVPVGSSTAPHLDNAFILGQSMLYLTSQTDGIQNNSPILGMFSSVLCGNTLTTYSQTLITHKNHIQANLTTSGSGTEGDPYVATSNLTPTEVSTISTFIEGLNTFISDRYHSDVNYFNNAKTISNDLSTVRRYSQMGQSESYLIQNFIGSPKLLSRLNANT